MKKKILVFAASPRKGGNSDLLSDEFIRGAKEAGHEIEKIYLKDKNINYCTGCGYCINRKNGCSQKDDMTEILTRMIASDVMVMATPVYFYTMNAQMKTLIDRTCARYTEIRDKEFYFIATAADENVQLLDRTIESFRGFTYCLTGAIEKGIICGAGAWKAGEIRGSKTMIQAYEMGLSA